MTGSKLKIENRRKRILELLRSCGRVTVAQLSDALQVTTVTIRNDLAALEAEGCLLRVQGGAISLPNGTAEQANGEGFDAFAGYKRAIGDAVAKLVRDGDTLFINSGTTSEHIAEALSSRKNLNVLTNSLQVAAKLGAVPTFRVLLVGGEINAQYLFTHGGDAQEQLGKYQADWAILSVDGISAWGGVTTHHAEEAVIDRMMAAGAKRIVIAADQRKIGRAGFSRVYTCDSDLMLVTNRGCDTQAIEEIAESGVQEIYT